MTQTRKTIEGNIDPSAKVHVAIVIEASVSDFEWALRLEMDEAQVTWTKSLITNPLYAAAIKSIQDEWTIADQENEG